MRQDTLQSSSHVSGTVTVTTAIWIVLPNFHAAVVSNIRLTKPWAQDTQRKEGGLKLISTLSWVMACSYGAITNAIFLSQLMGCMVWGSMWVFSGCDCDNDTMFHTAHYLQWINCSPNCTMWTDLKRTLVVQGLFTRCDKTVKSSFWDEGVFTFTPCEHWGQRSL